MVNDSSVVAQLKDASFPFAPNLIPLGIFAPYSRHIRISLSGDSKRVILSAADLFAAQKDP
jgi:hypothetical protein